jgi:hypothetical protein
MFAAKPPFAPLHRSLIRIMNGCRELVARASDPYRPELHYMRGPGPKWHAKHNRALQRAALRAAS